MAMKMKIKKGFSLLELTLVLGVGTMMMQGRKVKKIVKTSYH